MRDKGQKPQETLSTKEFRAGLKIPSVNFSHLRAHHVAISQGVVEGVQGQGFLQMVQKFRLSLNRFRV